MLGEFALTALALLGVGHDVDVEAGELLEDYFVMVEGGKITAVSNLPLEAEGAIRVDGTGKSLLPGMWDMHGHFGLQHGALNIAGGITSVRIIGGVHDKIMEMTEVNSSCMFWMSLVVLVTSLATGLRVKKARARC